MSKKKFRKYFSKSGDELQEYLNIFKKRHSVIPPKKGKGSYKRKWKAED